MAEITSLQRAVHRPSTTMSCDIFEGNFRSLSGSANANHSEPSPTSHRSMQSSVHPFQNHRSRSLILSEEDKSHLNVVCQPINRCHSNRPLWSRHCRKERSDSITSSEELHFSPHFPANDKFSYDLLTPQIMACFISPEGMSEMAYHKNSHFLSSKSLNVKSKSFRTLPVDQISGNVSGDVGEREDAGEDAGEYRKYIDRQDEETIQLSAVTSAYNPTRLLKGEKDSPTCEGAEAKSVDYLDEWETDFEKSRKQLRNVCHKEINRETSEENKKRKDIDAIPTEIPAYLFKEPLPYPLNKLDIGQMSREKVNWREVVRWNSVEPLMHYVLDRLFEIEQLQQETEENEIRRALTKQSIRVKPRPMNSRQATSVTLKPTGREKRCTENCLQSMCANNCPDKKSVLPSSLCHLCYRSLFEHGGCRWTNAHRHGLWNLFGQNSQDGYNYDQQSRLPGDKELTNSTLVTSVAAVTIRPRSCNPHKQSVTTAKSCRPKSSSVSSCMSDCPQEVAWQKQSKESSKVQGLYTDLKTAISRPKTTISKPSITKSKNNRNNLLPGKSHCCSEWNSETRPENQDAPRIVHSAKYHRKAKRKDKRNFTSISLLDQ